MPNFTQTLALIASMSVRVNSTILKCLLLLVFIGYFEFAGKCQENEPSMFSYSISECEEGDAFLKETELISEKYVGDTLYVEIAGSANCAGIYGVHYENSADTIKFLFHRGNEVHEVTTDTIYNYTIEVIEGVPDTTKIETVVTIEDDNYTVIDLCDCCYTFYFMVLGGNSKTKYQYMLNKAFVRREN